MHYTGWTTDGKMFDSSVKRGRAGAVPAQQRHQGLDRGPAADGRRREAPVLDPGRTSPTASQAAAARGDAGVRRRAARHQPAARRFRRRMSPPPPKNAKKTKSGIAYRC